MLLCAHYLRHSARRTRFAFTLYHTNDPLPLLSLTIRTTPRRKHQECSLLSSVVSFRKIRLPSGVIGCSPISHAPTSLVYLHRLAREKRWGV